nr:uncharacterized protein LOC119161475 [Rhipicephalus microplus]
MLEHHEKDCAYRTRPSGNQKANAEWREHLLKEHFSKTGPETRTQNTPTRNGNYGATTVKKRKPLQDNVHVCYTFEGNNDNGSIKLLKDSSTNISQLVELSSGDGEPCKDMCSLLHTQVNTSAICEPALSTFGDDYSHITKTRKAPKEVPRAHSQSAFKSKHVQDDAEGMQPSNTKQDVHIETSGLATHAYHGDHIGQNFIFRAGLRASSSAGCTKMEHSKSNLVSQGVHMEANETTREPSTDMVSNKTEPCGREDAKEPPAGKGPQESACHEGSLEARFTNEKMNSRDHSVYIGMESGSDTLQKVCVEEQTCIEAEGAARDGNSVRREDSVVQRLPSGVSSGAICREVTITNDEIIANALLKTSRSLESEENSIYFLEDTEEGHTAETVRNARLHKKHTQAINAEDITNNCRMRGQEARQRESLLDVATASQDSNVRQTLRHNLVKQGAQGTSVAAEICSRPAGHDPTRCSSSEISLSGPVECKSSDCEDNRSPKCIEEAFVHCHVENEAESRITDSLCTLNTSDPSSCQAPTKAFAENEELEGSRLRESECEPEVGSMSLQSLKEKPPLQQESNAWLRDDQKKKALSSPVSLEPHELSSAEQHAGQQEREESEPSLTMSASSTTGSKVLETTAMKDIRFQGQDVVHYATGKNEVLNTSLRHYQRSTFGTPNYHEASLHCTAAHEACERVAVDGKGHSHNAEIAPVTDNVFTGEITDGIGHMIGAALESVSAPFYLSYYNDPPAHFNYSYEEHNASGKPSCAGATTRERNNANTPHIIPITQQHQIRNLASDGDQKATETGTLGSEKVQFSRCSTTGENHTTAPLDDMSPEGETGCKKPRFVNSLLNDHWSLQGTFIQPLGELFPRNLSKTVDVSYTRKQSSIVKQSENAQKVLQELVHSSRLFRRSERLISGSTESTENKQVLREAVHETHNTAASSMSRSENPIVSELPMEDTEKSADFGQSGVYCERAIAENTDTNWCNTEASVEEASSNGETPPLRDKLEARTDPIDVLLHLKSELEATLAAIKQCIKKHPENNVSLREHGEKLREYINKVVEVCKAILQSSLKASESCDWYVENYDQLKKKVLQYDYWTQGRSTPLYLQGYNIKPSVLFRKKNGLLELGAEVTLCKGVYDDLLGWPFQKKSKLTLLHPSDDSRHVVFSMDGDNEFGYIGYLKPKGMHNLPVRANQYHSLQEIEEGGFVSDNKLYFRLEVSRE